MFRLGIRVATSFLVVAYADSETTTTGYLVHMPKGLYIGLYTFAMVRYLAEQAHYLIGLTQTALYAYLKIGHSDQTGG